MTPCELREVDTRGEEKEFHDSHCGVYIWMPNIIKAEIGVLLGHPVYSVGREMYGPMNNRTYGDRIFVQTGKRDGRYLLTFEVPEEQAKQVIAILEREKDTQW